MEQSQNIAKLLEDLKKASGLSLQLADTEDGIPENAEEKLSLLTAAWREKYDRNSFLRNLLCGTYSGADLYTAAALIIKMKGGSILTKVVNDRIGQYTWMKYIIPASISVMIRRMF